MLRRTYRQKPAIIASTSMNTRQKKYVHTSVIDFNIRGDHGAGEDYGSSLRFLAGAGSGVGIMNKQGTWRWSRS